MKLAYICPRYAPRSAGGAEVLLQSWAERMRQRGHYSEVLTTCARDLFTWENEYPPGEEVINGVKVNRFPVDPRDRHRHESLQDRISRGGRLSREEQVDWINSGVRSRPLQRYLEENRDNFDRFIFAPYLFGVTYQGVKQAGAKSVLVPCLHDEPFAYLEIMRELFTRAGVILLNSLPERELAEKLFPLTEKDISVVGMGIEALPELHPNSFRERFGIKSPYLLYAGRREGGKNTPLLIEYFRAFNRYHKTDLQLLLLGTGKVGLTKKDKNLIVDLGYLSEEDKWNCYAGSLAFCQPSVNESFSIVLLESWAAGRPALVNAACPVTLDHCRKSRGGLYFRDYYEFEECLLYFLDHPEEADRWGENGKQYVRENFQWKTILDRLEEALKKTVSGER